MIEEVKIYYMKAMPLMILLDKYFDELIEYLRMYGERTNEYIIVEHMIRICQLTEKLRAMKIMTNQIYHKWDKFLNKFRCEIKEYLV